MNLSTGLGMRGLGMREDNQVTTSLTGKFVTQALATPKNHVITAIGGFVKAISLGTKIWSASVQQDMLNLLTCLFRYGEQSSVATNINKWWSSTLCWEFCRSS
jgi:hypothetical protein